MRTVFYCTVIIFPFVAVGAGTFGVFAVAWFADSDLVGAGAGEGEAVLLADFRI